MDYLSTLTFTIYGISAIGVILGTAVALKIYSTEGAR